MIVRFTFRCASWPARGVPDGEKHTELVVQGDLEYVRKLWAEATALGWNCKCGSKSMMETREVLEPAGWRKVPGMEWDTLKTMATLQSIEAAGA